MNSLMKVWAHCRGDRNLNIYHPALRSVSHFIIYILSALDYNNYYFDFIYMHIYACFSACALFFSRYPTLYTNFKISIPYSSQLDKFVRELDIIFYYSVQRSQLDFNQHISSCISSLISIHVCFNFILLTF